VSSTHQLVDIHEALRKTLVDFICDKLGMYDVYEGLRENVIKSHFVIRSYYLIRNNFVICY